MAGEREALLIAVGDYDNPRLKKLRSPVQDSAELAPVLEDPAIGGFRVTSEINKPHYEVAQSIERFFQHRSPADLLLVHLSCHGIKDEDGQLYFATSDTDPDLPASTSVPAEFLRTQIQRSRARSIVLLLDCCYSGCFLTGMKAGDDLVDVREELAGRGRAVITATNRTEYAWEGDNLITLEPVPSRFTGVIVQGLRTGDADLDGDGKIGVDELYEYVCEQFQRQKVRQSPRKWTDLEYQIFLASSKRSPDARLSQRARTQRGEDMTIRLEMPLIETAFGAVRELAVDTFVVCDECAATGFGTVTEDPCPACRGDGRVRAQRTMRLRIPKGIKNGTLIQLAGEGEVGRCGGPPGDLYFKVVELADPRFSRRGDDLYTHLTIQSSLARRGGTLEVDTLEGTTKKVRIWPGKVRPGSVLRVAGAGVPHLDDAKEGSNLHSDPGRGDLFVEIHVQ